MKIFDSTANVTLIKTNVIIALGTNNSSEDTETNYNECTNSESFQGCYESIKSEFEGYKSENPSVDIKINLEGSLKGTKIVETFDSIDLYRKFLIEQELADSNALDTIDKNLKPCLVM